MVRNMGGTGGTGDTVFPDQDTDTPPPPRDKKAVWVGVLNSLLKAVAPSYGGVIHTLSLIPHPLLCSSTCVGAGAIISN